MKVVLIYLINAILYTSVSTVHGLLLLNPFWFREAGLNKFRRTQYLPYFSVWSIWF